MPLRMSKLIRRNVSGKETPQVDDPQNEEPWLGASPTPSSSMPTSPRSPRPMSFTGKDHRRHLSSQSGSGLHSILKNPVSPSLAANEYTNSSTATSSSSALAYAQKRVSNLSFDRTDTIDSFALDAEDAEADHEESRTTPLTSVSSISPYCPLPLSSGSHQPPFFMMTLASVSTLSFLTLPMNLRPIVLDAVARTWKKGVGKIKEADYQDELKKKHREKGYEGGVWEITLKGEAWVPSSSEQVSSKRILITLLTEFAKEGYNLCSSFRMSRKDTGKDTLIFLKTPQSSDPDPIFFAVAFYSHDRIFIIDAEAEVGQAIEEGIRNWWVDGVGEARVRERHCRELKLKGAPWAAHSAQSLISARCIHLTIMKIITHNAMGYDFVGSVDMADREEAEMPVTIYRRRWGTSTRAVWSLPEETTD